MDLPKHFRGDYKVVLEAVCKRGSNIRHASKLWLRTEAKIVYSAFDDEGSAILYVPDCPARRELLQNREYLEQILQDGCGDCLADAPEELQKDRQLMMLAVQNGYAFSARMVSHLGGVATPGDGKDFLLQLIAASNNVSSFYKNLPSYLQEDFEVAKATIHNKVTETMSNAAMNIMVRHDVALTSEDIVAAVRKGCLEFLNASDKMKSLMGEKDFVLMLCRVDGNCLEFASDELNRDVECLVAAIKGEKPLTIETLLQTNYARPWNEVDFAEAVIRLAETASYNEKRQIGSRIPRKPRIDCNFEDF